ncbi:hypothetical protein ACFQL7_21375 [Halocatena marina]|uniref:Uncharacterized protein n=1 Tax=Halocatena marina TaxID=2934937 RepID=A0ABD5YRS6_9EURY
MRQRFDTRLTHLQTSLDALEPIDPEARIPSMSVWTTTGDKTITRACSTFSIKQTKQSF